MKKGIAGVHCRYRDGCCVGTGEQEEPEEVRRDEMYFAKVEAV